MSLPGGKAMASGIAFVGLLAGPLLAGAEVQVLEVVGAIPIYIDSRLDRMPREAAVEEGLRQGVSRVAQSLVRRSAPIVGDPMPETSDDLEGGEEPDTPAEGVVADSPSLEDELGIFLAPEARREREKLMRRIQQVLGRKMVSYTKTFRIVEDQGERPALFTQHPDAATEYVVVMEVEVEVERVRDRLEGAGLVDPVAAVDLTGIQIELRGLSHYGGYQEFLDLLAEDAVGAVEVSAKGFTPHGATIRVEGDWRTEELLERLQAASPANMSISEFVPSVSEPGIERASEWTSVASGLVLTVDWVPGIERLDRIGGD